MNRPTIISVALLSLGVVFAIPCPPAARADEPWDFQTPKAREARAKYDKALQQAREDYEARQRELQKQLLSDLEAALKHAMTVEQDLDEAIRIRDAMREVQRSLRRLGAGRDPNPGARSDWRYYQHDRFGTCVNPTRNTKPRDLKRGLTLADTIKGRQMLTADLDGDGRTEVVLSDGNALRAVRPGGEQLWEVGFERPVRLVFIEDFDPAEGLEIVGACQVERGEMFVPIVSSTGKVLRRIGFDVDQEGLMPRCAADLDGDGEMEIVAAVGSGYGNHRRGVWVFQYPSGKEKWHFEIGPSPGWMIAEDCDGDGKKEVLLGMGSPHNGNSANGYSDSGGSWVLCLSHDGKVKWDAKLGTWGLEPVLADVDGDGTLEAVVFRNQDYYGGNAALYVLRLKDGEVLYRHDGKADDSCWRGVVGDLDHDGKVEVFATFGVQERCLMALDWKLKPTAGVDWKPRTAGRDAIPIARAAGDLGGDGALELITADYQGSGFQVRSANLDLLYSGRIPGSEVGMVLVTDLDNDGANELVVGGEGQFYIYKAAE